MEESEEQHELIVQMALFVKMTSWALAAWMATYFFWYKLGIQQGAPMMACTQKQGINNGTRPCRPILKAMAILSFSQCKKHELESVSQIALPTSSGLVGRVMCRTYV
jgi:hypothetical protein